MNPQLVNYNGQLINLNGGVIANKFPIRDGLVFYLDGGVDKCYAGTGTTATDLSVSSVSTSLNNGVVFSEDNKGYFSFDGVNDNMATDANIDLTHTAEHTVCIWVRHPNKPNYLPGIWLEQSSNYNSNYGAFYTGWSPFGVPGAIQHSIRGYNGGGKYQGAYTDDPYDSNTWQFFVATYDGTQPIGDSIKMYMNGEEIAYTQRLPTDSSIYATFVNWTGDLNRFYFGSRAGNNYFTEFDLGAYYVYDRVLSQDEIRAIYNHQKQRFEHIITDGLVLDLDATNLFSYPGTGTTWSDLSPSGNDGTLTNSPTFQSDPPAIVFDGVDDYVEGDHSIDISPTSITLEVWLKPNGEGSNPDSYGGNIFSTRSGANAFNSGAALLFSWNDSRIIFVTDINDENHIVSNQYLQNEIHHVVATYDPTIGYSRVYVDGSLVSEEARTHAIKYDPCTNCGYQVGRWGYGPTYNRHFNGNIYETRVYDRALTADEIEYNFNARRGRYGI
jgi:hypothetical protein